jgi:hypothetical protein
MMSYELPLAKPSYHELFWPCLVTNVHVILGVVPKEAKVDYNAFAAWTALAGAVVAIIALIIQQCRARQIHSVDLIMKLIEQFDSDEFRKKRRKAAKVLLARIDETDEQPGVPEVDDILNFFENMCYLQRIWVLSKQLIWVNFYNWLHGYYHSAARYIAETRRADVTGWKELCAVDKKLARIEEREVGRITKLRDKSSTEKDELKIFLSGEIRLPKK